MFDYSGFRQIQVLLVVRWGVFTELGYIVLLYSLPDYASSIGLAALQGSLVGTLLNLGLALGRLVVGLLLRCVRSYKYACEHDRSLRYCQTGEMTQR